MIEQLRAICCPRWSRLTHQRGNVNNSANENSILMEDLEADSDGSRPGAPNQETFSVLDVPKAMSERSFLAELKACMYDSSRLKSFMEQATTHPPYGWHKALILFSYANSPARLSHIDPDIVANFILEVLANFPDVLQRVLLQSTYAGPNYNEAQFSAVHTSVICRQTKIVELLTTLGTREQIKRCLVECAKGTEDGFEAVERAALWSNLKELSHTPYRSELLAAFMKEFRQAKKPDKLDMLQNMIEQAEHHPEFAWQTVLQWASASGNNHIVRDFKDKWPHRFESIHSKSQGDGFAPLRATSLKGKEAVLKGRQEIYDLVSDLVDLADDSVYNDLLAKNLHCRRGHGWTGLHLATILGDGEMVGTLIECYNNHRLWISVVPDELDGSKLSTQLNGYNDFRDDFWMTPLHYAVMGDFKAVVKKLLAWPIYVPHINAFNLFIRTPLHAACSDPGRVSMLESLMENPATDVNCADCCSFSPLHWAVYVGGTGAIKFLLSRASDPERPLRISEEDVQGRQAFSIAVENETWKLLMSLPEVKEEVERLYRDRQVYVDAANAILVGAALIASVTFGGWLSPPHSDPTDLSNRKVQAYWAFNSLSFFFSVSAVMSGAAAVLPVEEAYIGNTVRSIREWLILTSSLLIVSVVFVLGAFTAAGFSSLETSVPGLWRNMLVSTTLGCLVCGAVGVSFVQKLYWICRARSLKTLLLLLGYLVRTGRSVGRGCLTKSQHMDFLDSTKPLQCSEAWTVVAGNKWRRRETDWRRLRGFHRFRVIPTTTCRKYALQFERSAFGMLLAESGRLQDMGSKMADEYGDIWTVSMAPAKKERKLKLDRRGSPIY